MSLLTGKIVCVTGSSRGIGRACAIECAKHGATGLVLHYFGDDVTEGEIRSLKAEIEGAYTYAKVATVPGDIADPATAVKAIAVGVESFGRIDVLVSNAGICPFADFLTMPHATWERTRQVNLDGTFYVTQAVANQMKTQVPQGGAIIGISSISALVGGGTQCHYTPTKAGILSLMQSCAIALGKYNIRANAVLPGTIATDINKEDLADEKKKDGMIQRTCLRRLGGESISVSQSISSQTSSLAPDDIAGPVVFLASDLAKYVTGASLLVDGGLFVNLQ
ncbi:hypothetical protein NM688_g4610 [Phlebia brevispora]|uniref:Uncharacterized protein n=1 Tax=Phlebia brevispora TaxID=194682 RepID=A0ACC1T266_9APHY|nr:hypothetical protein NM688_g4610 [Phlebia brevispora]